MSNGVSAATRVIVVGAAGRMGSRVCVLACADERFALVGALERAGDSSVGRGAAPESARGGAVKIGDSAAVFRGSGADVVIDFSGEGGVAMSVAAARASGAALLVGTTGLSESAVTTLRQESAGRAVILAPNTSMGVAALSDLVRRAAGMLKGFDCSIVESHHAQKKDAPSGTALRLARAAREGGAQLPDQQVVSMRGGDVVGEHTVRFAGPGEYLELTHRATSRDLFARGSLVAAAWLRGRAPGWYTMEDVLGLTPR
jgi:4-hydroxy-tetrahydrodipicolinate reductase